MIPSSRASVPGRFAAKYFRLVVDRQLHHNSAICHIATTLLTRIATCLRNNTPYVVRDIDGRELDRVEAASQTGVNETPLQVDSLGTNLRA